MKSLLLIIVFLSVMMPDHGQVSILVNQGRFASVPLAAAGEEKVNFFDGDFSDDRACTECFAATELASFLPAVAFYSADEIKFPGIGKIPDSGHVFIIGSRSSNPLIVNYSRPEDHGFTDKEQSFRIRSFTENGRVITIIEGADRAGTLYGVYRYLEAIGIKFIGLGKTGTILPVLPVELPSDINITENPSYLTRGFYTWDDRKSGKEFFLWMARNRYNYWTAMGQPVKLLKKLGIKLSDGGHRIQGVVFNSDDEYQYNHPKFRSDENKPADPYTTGTQYMGDENKDGRLSLFEAHPEWYGMKNGERTKISYSDNAAQSGINFCTSNKDARKEFSRRIVQQLIDGQWQYVDLFEFWLFDGRENIWCSCDKCKAAGSYTDKMMLVNYDILKELERARQTGKLKRRVEVSANAYHATLDPPSKPLPGDYDYENSSVTFFPIGRCYAHPFADPLCTEINQWQLKAYQSWTTGEQRYYRGSMFIGEYFNVSSLKSLPAVYTKIMAVDIPWYYNAGARQFNYMHTPDRMWGTWTLNQYLLGKLLWDINSDVARILDEYFSSYYPLTTCSTRLFYEQLEKATANIKILKHYVETGDRKNFSLSPRLLKGDPFQLDHLHYDTFHPVVNDADDVTEMMESMDQAKHFLDKSLIDCKKDDERQRLLEDKMRFDYGYAMYRYIYHLIRTSLFHKRKIKCRQPESSCLPRSLLQN